MTDSPTPERDYLAEFDLASKRSRSLLMEAGRHINYLRTLLRDLRPFLPADHPWLPGIEEQIALAPQELPEELFMGHAVWLEAGNVRSQDVSAVLDAVVRLVKKRKANGDDASVAHTVLHA